MKILEGAKFSSLRFVPEVNILEIEANMRSF